MPQVTALSALTLLVSDMAASTAFYEALGFERLFGGPETSFTSYRAGDSYLNLMLGAVEQPEQRGPSNPFNEIKFRAIFYVDDVDQFHAQAVAAGIEPLFAPRDAPWRERYFHLRDPDGHEISFAKPLRESD